MADVIVEFGAKVDELVSAVNEVKGKLGEVESAAEGVGEGFRIVGETILAYLGVEKIMEFVESMAELGMQTMRTAAMIGASVGEVVQLGGVAALTGTSVDTLAMGMERMSLNIQRSTRDGFNPATQALNNLGITAQQFIALDTPGKFDMLRKAVSEFNPSMNLTNAVMQVGGRGIAQMIPLLQMNDEEWEKNKEAVEAAREGLAAAVPGMEETHVKLTLLDQSIQSLGARIFNVLKPAIDEAIEWMTKWVQSIDSETISEAVVRIGIAIGNVIRIVGTLGIEAVRIFQDVGDEFIKMADRMGGAANTLANFAINPTATAAKLLLEKIKSLRDVEAEPAGLPEQVDRMADAYSTLGTFVEKTTNAFVALGAAEAEPAGMPTQAAENLKKDMAAINMAAKATVDAAVKEQTDLIAIYQKIEQQKEAINAQAFVNLKITKLQEIRANADAQQDMYQDQLEVANKAAELLAGQPAKYQAMQDKIKEIQLASDTAQIKTDTQMVQAQAATFESAANDITSAWNSQLKGLITGTTTWKQAMTNIWEDLAVKIIEELEKVLVKIIAVAAAQMALNVATGGGLSLAGFGAALTGGGGIAGMIGQLLAALGKYQQGTSYVPETQLALVHKGEMIIPPGEAQAIRAGESSLGGGNLTLNLSVSTLDTSTMASWLRGQGGQLLAKSISQLWSQNPGLRPAYGG